MKILRKGSEGFADFELECSGRREPTTKDRANGIASDADATRTPDDNDDAVMDEDGLRRMLL
jgi:hypothetical protein